MGRLDPLMFMAAICQEFGWTYNEYMEQPHYFIQAIREKLIRDRKREERELNKARYGR
jgi:L-asparaginase II